MIKFPKIANNIVIRYLLALALILGALILVVGISGITMTQKLSNQVEKINDTSFGPALAFDEIINSLDSIEMKLFKLQNSAISSIERADVYKSIRRQIGIIHNIKNEQLVKAESENYYENLKLWNKSWALFQNDMTNYIDVKNINSASNLKVANLEADLVSLRTDIGAVRESIKYDVTVIIENSQKLAHWSLIFLSAMLLIGVVVGFFASSIIGRHIKDLFTAVEESKKSIEVLFNNLEEGFFIFDKNGDIQKGVSGAAKKIFGQDLVGSKFVDVLQLDKEKKKQALAWQELSFSGIYDFDDFKSVAPRSIEINERYIELDFRPIYSDIQLLDRVICISVDKTNEKILRERALEETALVKLIIGIVNDRLAFSNDVIEIRNLIFIIKEELTHSSLNLGPLLRAVHTLKGCAATRHIISVAKLAHNFETKVATYITENGLSETEKLIAELKNDTGNIEKVFETFMMTNEKVFEALLGKESYKTKTVEMNVVNELCRLLLENTQKDSQLMTYFVEHFMKDNIVLSFAHYAELVRELATRQKKKIDVIILNSEFTINPVPYKALLASLSHVFTNAVDHGIESPSERLKNSKAAVGSVTVSFKKNTNPTGETLLIQIEDDGRGISWEKVRDSAIKKKKITADQAKVLSPEECLQLIFLNSFSTTEVVTDISGRGMGTDAVSNEAGKLGGRAWVKSQPGKGTSFFIEVPNFDNLLLSQTIEKLKLKSTG